MALITLTTDFGQGSPYVAAMKGVVLSAAPHARLIDITHAIPPQDVRAGAIVLDDVTRYFPGETINVAVVDPGVGTSRRLLYVRIGAQQYVLPDNGLISRLAARERPTTIVAIEEPKFARQPTSATFHGRDILAPVAAQLALGLPPAKLGPAVADWVRLDWPEVSIVAGKIEGRVESIDSFGNLITDITAEMLESAPTGEQVTIRCDEHETTGIFRTYADQPEMTLIALVGSTGRLELAIVGDSAAMMLGVRAGERVTVTW
jgi:S-adenosylmethionine hydrolase